MQLLTDYSTVKDRRTDHDLGKHLPKQIVNWGTAVIVPTLNAEAWLPVWVEGLRGQSVMAEKTIIVDSESTDHTVAIAEEAGFEVISVKRATFSHGGTRQAIVDQLPRCELIVFLTQDAVLSRADSLEKLISMLDDQKVGAAYGRQLPREEASQIEAHARLFNYSKKSHIRDRGDIPRLGIKSSFISNSFAVWRKSALNEVGGFPNHTIQNEDAWVASKMIQAGWKVAYCAEATVTHSHQMSFIDEFKRYFDTGVFHAQAPWISKEFGSAGGEGLKFVKSELRHLAQTQPSLIGSAIARTGVKLVAFKLGRQEKILPIWLKEKMSNNRGFWIQKINEGNGGS